MPIRGSWTSFKSFSDLLSGRSRTQQSPTPLPSILKRLLDDIDGKIHKKGKTGLPKKAERGSRNFSSHPLSRRVALPSLMQACGNLQEAVEEKVNEISKEAKAIVKKEARDHVRDRAQVRREERGEKPNQQPRSKNLERSKANVGGNEPGKKEELEALRGLTSLLGSIKKFGYFTSSQSLSLALDRLQRLSREAGLSEENPVVSEVKAQLEALLGGRLLLERSMGKPLSPGVVEQAFWARFDWKVEQLGVYGQKNAPSFKVETLRDLLAPLKNPGATQEQYTAAISHLKQFTNQQLTFSRISLIRDLEALRDHGGAHTSQNIQDVLVRSLERKIGKIKAKAEKNNIVKLDSKKLDNFLALLQTSSVTQADITPVMDHLSTFSQKELGSTMGSLVRDLQELLRQGKNVSIATHFHDDLLGVLRAMDRFVKLNNIPSIAETSEETTAETSEETTTFLKTLNEENLVPLDGGSTAEESSPPNDEEKSESVVCSVESQSEASSDTQEVTQGFVEEGLTDWFLFSSALRGSFRDFEKASSPEDVRSTFERIENFCKGFVSFMEESSLPEGKSEEFKALKDAADYVRGQVRRLALSRIVLLGGRLSSKEQRLVQNDLDEVQNLGVGGVGEVQNPAPVAPAPSVKTPEEIRIQVSGLGKELHAFTLRQTDSKFPKVTVDELYSLLHRTEDPTRGKGGQKDGIHQTLIQVRALIDAERAKGAVDGSEPLKTLLEGQQTLQRLALDVTFFGTSRKGGGGAGYKKLLDVCEHLPDDASFLDLLETVRDHREMLFGMDPHLRQALGLPSVDQIMDWKEQEEFVFEVFQGRSAAMDRAIAHLRTAKIMSAADLASFTPPQKKEFRAKILLVCEKYNDLVMLTRSYNRQFEKASQQSALSRAAGKKKKTPDMDLALVNWKKQVAELETLCEAAHIPLDKVSIPVFLGEGQNQGTDAEVAAGAVDTQTNAESVSQSEKEHLSALGLSSSKEFKNIKKTVSNVRKRLVNNSAFSWSLENSADDTLLAQARSVMSGFISDIGALGEKSILLEREEEKVADKKRLRTFLKQEKGENARDVLKLCLQIIDDNALPEGERAELQARLRRQEEESEEKSWKRQARLQNLDGLTGALNVNKYQDVGAWKNALLDLDASNKTDVPSKVEFVCAYTLVSRSAHFFEKKQAELTVKIEGIGDFTAQAPAREALEIEKKQLETLLERDRGFVPRSLYTMSSGQVQFSSDVDAKMRAFNEQFLGKNLVRMPQVSGAQKESEEFLAARAGKEKVDALYANTEEMITSHKKLQELVLAHDALCEQKEEIEQRGVRKKRISIYDRTVLQKIPDQIKNLQDEIQVAAKDLAECENKRTILFNGTSEPIVGNTARDCARYMIRAAVLSAWETKTLETGQKKDSSKNKPLVDVTHFDSSVFEPHKEREKIVALLRNWGLDTDLFHPEIEENLGRPITRNLLDRWGKEGLAWGKDWSGVTVRKSVGKLQARLETKGQKQQMKGRLLGKNVLERAAIRVQERVFSSVKNPREISALSRSIIESWLRSLEGGDDIDLIGSRGVKVGVSDTTPTPVTVSQEISGVGKVTVELYGTDGATGKPVYKVIVTGGYTGETKVGVNFAKLLGLAGSIPGARLKFGVDANGKVGRGKGFTVYFEKSDEGREDVIDFVHALCSKRKVNTSMFMKAQQVLPHIEWDGSGGVGVSALVGVSPFNAAGFDVYADTPVATSVHFGEGDYSFKGAVGLAGNPFGYMKAGFGVSVGKKGGKAQNTHSTLTKTSQSFAIAATASAGVAATKFLPLQGLSPIVEGEITVSGQGIRLNRFVTDIYGNVIWSKGSNASSVTDVRTLMQAAGLFLSVNDEDFARQYNENIEIRKEIDAICARMKSDDFFYVTYILAPEKLAEINGHFRKQKHYEELSKKLIDLAEVKTGNEAKILLKQAKEFHNKAKEEKKKAVSLRDDPKSKVANAMGICGTKLTAAQETLVDLPFVSASQKGSVFAEKDQFYLDLKKLWGKINAAA